jgi:CheY-like chemotaxis protein
MRLLVVEDNEQLAGLLTEGLQAAGYETDVLSSLEEASTVLRTTFYAALILDLGLPDGDGLALLRDLRHRNNPIPVMVLTARGGLQDRVQGLRSGADDGEAVRVGGTDRAAGSPIAAARQSAGQLAAVQVHTIRGVGYLIAEEK